MFYRGDDRFKGVIAPLLELGIAESALSWFTSYLSNRTYHLTWNGSLSKPCSLDTGVPQGSVLGPQISRLCNCITWFFISLLCRRHPAIPLSSFDKVLIATHISEYLADVSTWISAHYLRLDLNKTELLLIPGKDCPQLIGDL